jgi:hypothetical protein
LRQRVELAPPARFAVDVGEEDVASFDPSRHHVVQGTGRVQSSLSGDGRRLHPPNLGCNALLDECPPRCRRIINLLAPWFVLCSARESLSVVRITRYEPPSRHPLANRIPARSSQQLMNRLGERELVV